VPSRAAQRGVAATQHGGPELVGGRRAQEDSCGRVGGFFFVCSYSLATYLDHHPEKIKKLSLHVGKNDLRWSLC